MPTQETTQQVKPISPDQRTAQLERENQRLQRELKELRSLLLQIRAGASPLPTEPTVAANFSDQQIAGVYDLYKQSASGTERLEILKSLRAFAAAQSSEIFPILGRALDDPDPDLERIAAELLGSYQMPQVLPLLEKALKSRDEDTRLSALSPLEYAMMKTYLKNKDNKKACRGTRF